MSQAQLARFRAAIEADPTAFASTPGAGNNRAIQPKKAHVVYSVGFGTTVEQPGGGTDSDIDTATSTCDSASSLLSGMIFSAFTAFALAF